MDTHFKTICDDGSPDELGELLCVLWRKCCDGDFSLCDQLQSQMQARVAQTAQISAVSQSKGLHAGDAIDSDSEGSDDGNDAAEQMLREAYQEARARGGAGGGGGMTRIGENGGDDGEGMDMDTGGERESAPAPPMLVPLEPLVDREGFETVVVGKKKKAYKKA